MALYASASPRPVSPEGIALATPEAAQERVKRAARQSTEPLEKEIQAEILDYLKAHVNVRALCRINSGVMQEGERFIRMNTVYGKKNGMYMRMADIQAIHWPSGRAIAIEVKRGSWKQPSGKREHEQAAYLECVREAGGLAIFATSVDEVRRLLEAA